MGFQIRFNSAVRTVSAIFFDRVELADKIASARQVAEKYGHLNPLSILVDVRNADIDMTIEERRQFGAFAAHLPGLSHARIAVLHAADRNANVVINSTAQSEGMHIVEFVSEQAALNWLRSADTSDVPAGH
ncbi:hypothetical protein [Microbulbifer sp. YPW1]|uniref:hypothetical protein n=1 Tax=Microbulbifer sp. YPW1 TaxID=2745199 RepID=UPI001599F483|nr:hypothetical protein [Microbulbifer sp. YPW1]QKX17437.1 hypothetical protein HUW35_10755 [Microbulbifer sp. YPW1]